MEYKEKTPEGISVEIPEKVFFSQSPKENIVKNDFYITIFKSVPKGNKNIPTSSKKDGEDYPKIYIKGFEKLFSDSVQIDNFTKMFYITGDGICKDEWTIAYGRFRETDERCVVITCVSDTLDDDFLVEFHLSDKCAFTNAPKEADAIKLDVYVDGYDFFFEDISEEIQYSRNLERRFAVYVKDFGAYLSTDPEHKVSAVHKGTNVNISWKLEDDVNASAYLYDESELIGINLPPYETKIDKDKKFTLTVYNDFCSVTQSIIVYRSLWDKTDISLKAFPQSDQKGRFKFFRSYGGAYYLYIHPNLYTSTDLVNWSVFSKNTAAPSDFNYYSANYSEYRVGVCYLNNDTFTYCEMRFSSNEWTEFHEKRENLISAHVLISQKTTIMLASKKNVVFYELVNGSLINAKYLTNPTGVSVVATDALSTSNHSYYAILYDNNRVYFYDYEDDWKNNIFECPGVSNDNVYLVKSNAFYILLDGYTFEVTDREKFSDLHFSPQYGKEARPVIGAMDSETIVGMFQTKQGNEMWKYKF